MACRVEGKITPEQVVYRHLPGKHHIETELLQVALAEKVATVAEMNHTLHVNAPIKRSPHLHSHHKYL